MELCNAYPEAGAYVLDVRLTPRKRIGWLEDALTDSRKLENKEYEGFHIGNLGNVLYKMGGEGEWCRLLQRRLVQSPVS